MSQVTVRVTSLDTAPYERCHVTDEATELLANKVLTVTRWDCKKCSTLVTERSVLRRINTRCSRHRCLLPPKEAK